MKSLLVTGGSGGIGEETCLLASSKAWNVYVGYHQGQDRANSVVANIKKSGGKAQAIFLPLEDRQGMMQGFTAMAKSTERLDAVVLCASPGPVMASFLKAETNAFSEQFQINVIGNHALITLAWKQFFSKQEGGHVIAVLSEAANSPPKPQMTPYVIGKRALQDLLECALQELGSSGLRVSTVSPGFTETKMLQNFHPHIVEAARATQNNSKFLEPAQVAQKILYCLEHVPQTSEIAHYSISNAR